MQTHIIYDHKKLDFLRVNMLQAQLSLQTSVCWHSKCFISMLVLTRVCVYVCAYVDDPLSKVSGVCCKEILVSVAT